MHLSEPAREIIIDIFVDKSVTRDELLFSTTGGRTPVQAYSKAKTRLDKIMTRLNGGTPIERWVLHDLRRTGTTVLAKAGFPPHVVDKLLNHVGGSISGVAAVYNRHDYQAERKAALDALAAHIMRLAA